MFWRKREQKENRDLDQLGRMVIRASGLSKREAEDAASSPFLLQRIRARIEEEQKSRAKPDYGWSQMLLVARRALPAMAIIAIVAVGLLWLAGMRTSTKTMAE